MVNAKGFVCGCARCNREYEEGRETQKWPEPLLPLQIHAWGWDPKNWDGDKSQHPNLNKTIKPKVMRVLKSMTPVNMEVDREVQRGKKRRAEEQGEVETISDSE